MASFMELDKDLEPKDIELCDLYFKAIKQLLDMDDPKNTSGFSRYLKLLRTVANANCEFYKDSDDQDDTLTALFMENLYYRLAYVYRNSTLYSSAVAFHFQKVLERNPAILEELLKKRVIRICSLGCGPASDVVGVIRTLESAAMERGIHLDIRVTVVDADLSWRNTCLGVLRCIPMFDNAIWKIRFIQADLSQFFTIETVEAIQNADVVTLVKFSSEFVAGYLNCRDTIKEIFETMNPRSLLFFLDRPSSDVMRSCGGINGDVPNFCLVYEEIYDFFNLHLAAVEKHFHMYEKHFGANVLNTCFKVFCRAWLRSECGCSLADSSVWRRTQSTSSSGSLLCENECEDMFSPSWLKPEYGNRSAYPSMTLECCDNLTPSWLKSENKSHLASTSHTLNCSVSMISSSLPRSEREYRFASSDQPNVSPPNLECVDSLTNSSWPRPQRENRSASSSFNLDCGDGLANSSLPRSERENVLASLPALLISQTENCLKILPKERFGNKREKFDVWEFFRVRPYRTWHYAFCVKMEGKGWNWRGMDIYFQNYEHMWNELFVNLQEKTQMMEDIQEELIVNIQRQSGVINEYIWKKFMISKRELGFVKRTIYCKIVITLRGYLKSKFPIHKISTR